jgi:hypothetical protein
MKTFYTKGQLYNSCLYNTTRIWKHARGSSLLDFDFHVALAVLVELVATREGLGAVLALVAFLINETS